MSDFHDCADQWAHRDHFWWYTDNDGVVYRHWCSGVTYS